MKILNVLVAMILASCTTERVEVSNPSDYEAYLNAKPVDLESLYKRETLWKKKISLEPRGFTFYEKLGSTYNEFFEKTGDVNYLHLADSLFSMAENQAQGKWKVPSMLSLSSISIKKHDFKTAASLAVAANQATDEKFGPLLMQYDAEMELGNYQMAKALLDQCKRMDSFDYLVRLSKYKDYEGDLDSAIYYMEKASEKVLQHQERRKLWATANLADMYGHAGRVEDSYAHYLKALAQDPTYIYAMKGIAWIAFAHDRKTKEAKEILVRLQAKTAMPDYYIQLAEISEFEGDLSEATAYTHLFVIEASKSKYGGMYNQYLIDIFNKQGKFEKAMRLANEEVRKRPTPAAFDWLAWTLHNRGETDEAVRLYQENVEGATFEPDVLYRMGVVFYEAENPKGKHYLNEVLDASFELGPQVTRDIKLRLKG